MTDEERLYKLDNGSDTARWAAEEIRRLREENAALTAEVVGLKGCIAKCKMIMECNDPGNYEDIFGGNHGVVKVVGGTRNGEYTIPLSRHPVAPEGYKLVPIEPTEEMIEAGFQSSDWIEHYDHVLPVYKAMLSAAPEGK